MLGISNDTHVIVYDSSEPPRCGLEVAPRLWYTFRIFGHNRVSELNGGSAKWIAEKRSTTKETLKEVKSVKKYDWRPGAIFSLLDKTSDVSGAKSTFASDQKV